MVVRVAGRRLTVAEALEVVRAHGFTPSHAYSSNGRVFAFSVESFGAGTYGHPRLEVVGEARE